MHTNRMTPAQRAFTLIELMVVIAIIALLVGVLLPVFGTIRTKARNVQTSAQFSALDTGLNMFRSESALGDTLPPSASDNEDRQIIANPKRDSGGNGGSPEVKISGAHLLVHAMIGADGLGTPGFRDFDGDYEWWNDTYDEEDGAYHIDPDTGQEQYARYGGAGYVDDKMKQRALSFADLVDKGVVQGLDCDNPSDQMACDELVFVDPWDTPILYYKANPSSLFMTADAGLKRTGVYWQEDNGIITGSDSGNADYVADGLDFGPGKVSGRHHAIAVAISPEPTTPVDLILVDPTYDDSFARFILDPSVMARPTPVKRDSYLLISAGPDARYGTDDDVTNWTRAQD